MAFEAIEFDAGGDVATRTKMLFAFDTRNLSVCIRRNMAIDTLGEAGFFGAYALAYRLLAFMQQHAHVTGAHFVDRGNAVLAFWCWHNIAMFVAVRTEIIGSKHLRYSEQ